MSKLFGETLFGSELWGGTLGAVIPFVDSGNRFRVLFYNSIGGKIADYNSATGQRIIESIDFELNETGCGAFKIEFTRQPELIAVGDIIEIYLMDDSTPYYKGYVQHIPEDGRTDKSFVYSGFGLIAKLDDIIINTILTSREIGGAITYLLETEILPKQPFILENLSKIELTGLTAQVMDFSLTKAKKAIFDLVNQAGNYTAGVDALGEFFFKARSTAIQQAAVKAVAKHISTFTPSQNNQNIVNKIFINAGVVSAGSNYITYVEDLASQAGYGIKEDVETIPTTTNITDATRWAQRILTDKKDPVITAKITGINILELREKINAEGKARILLEGN